IVVIAVLAIVLLYGIMKYNSFIAQFARIEEAWADIDVQLKRRYDLIPNLMEAVKGYMEHESQTFQKVTEARTQAMQADTMEEHQQAENMLTGALKSLFAVSESYPELRATENFQQFQKELADTENKIQAARRFYNANVRDYNTDVEQFPENVIANMGGFDKREYFEIEEAAARENVKVDF
ncbi:MAG: LemA family protein, partial [Candidatus Paceibacterota bacterium]